MGDLILIRKFKDRSDFAEFICWFLRGLSSKRRGIWIDARYDDHSVRCYGLSVKEQKICRDWKGITKVNRKCKYNYKSDNVVSVSFRRD